jgi:hypothetical protein
MKTKTPMPDKSNEYLNTVRGHFGNLTAISRIPNTATIRMADGQKATFACGLYLVTAGGGIGKSVVTRALTWHACSSGWNEVTHIYVFEPGAPTYPIRTVTGEEGRLFEDPVKFLTPGWGGSDLETYLRPVIGTIDAPKRKEGMPPALVVIDSIGDAMRSYLAEDRAGMGAAEQGLQPADRSFVESLNNFAEDKSLVILGAINTEIVPFAAKLEGSCQGVVNVSSITGFSKRDRAGGRSSALYLLSEKAIAAGIAIMRYPEARVSGTGHGEFITS